MTLAEEINRMIERVIESLEITSANPTHINHVIQINQKESPDLEKLIREAQTTDPDSIKRQVDITDTIKSQKQMISGNVGDIQRMTENQFGNIKALANNPVGFFMSSIMRKFAKGAGIAAFALFFFEIVKYIISELLKPGRFLDRRFRRDITKEILAFRSREEKQKLRQGYSSIIVTTMGGLRGGQGQRSGNLRVLAGLQPQPITNNFEVPSIVEQAAGGNISNSRGRGRFRA